MAKRLFLILSWVLTTTLNAGTFKSGNLYLVSVGINDYSGFYIALKGCVHDSQLMSDKIKQDYRSYIPNGNINSYLLHDHAATRDSIQAVFKKIALEAKPNDYFVFYYTGMSVEDKNLDTYLIPYASTYDKLENVHESTSAIPLKILASWMEGIQAEKQLVISEAGSGNDFATNLIVQLFEQNPVLANETKRNRIIITTKGLAWDIMHCANQNVEMNGGALAYLLNKQENIMKVFDSPLKFEFQLKKSEIECNPKNGDSYISIYNERDFSNMLVKQYAKGGSGRGADTGQETVVTPTEKHEPKNYALFIANTDYLPESKWSRLRNPLRDVRAIGKILNEKYNCDTIILHNAKDDEVIKKIVQLKEVVDTNDRFILFVAGHGYYSNVHSDVFMVCSNSGPNDDEYNLENYIQLPTIGRLVDNFRSKNVLVVFDICFGAYFDLNNQDVPINDYKGVKIDVSIDEFIKRKSEGYTRMYLASGASKVPDYQPDNLNHSPFADKIITALNTEKIFISPGKLFTQLEGNITKCYLKQFGRHESRGDFLMKVIVK